MNNPTKILLSLRSYPIIIKIYCSLRSHPIIINVARRCEDKSLLFPVHC